MVGNIQWAIPKMSCVSHPTNKACQEMAVIAGMDTPQEVSASVFNTSAMISQIKAVLTKKRMRRGMA